MKHPSPPSLDDVKRVFDTPLVFNATIDTGNIKNILLIDSLVSESKLFFDSANSDTFPIIYSYNSNRTELSQLLDKIFSNLSLQRIAFVFHNNITDGKVFLNQELMFLDSDILENVSTFSPNTQLLIDTIQKFNVKHIDFLACNSLNYLNWKGFYSMLTKQTSVVVGASNDKTGNLNYGGDWVMENTNENVVNRYFNSNIQNYTSTLDSTLEYSGGTLYIQQSGSNIQYQYNSTSGEWTTVSSWPVTIINNTPESETVLTVQFTTNIKISYTTTGTGTNGYFITGSNYITYDGSNNTVTISDVIGYPGLIQNGSSGQNGNHAITVKNINTVSVNSIMSDAWICQSNFGINIKNISGYVPILIDNCSNKGDLSQYYQLCGGIVGPFSFDNGHGIIQNCHNTGIIRAWGQGGICGVCVGQNGGTVTITNCYNTGNITGGSCGGIVSAYAGNITGIVTITNCYNTGTITNGHGGGIIGSNAGYNNGTVIITNCYNMGDINSDYTGGITSFWFGYNTNNLCSITNCCNLGNINGFQSGGICGAEVGYNNDALYTPQISIINCYSLGNIATTCGGILAGSYNNVYNYNPIVNIINCYTAYDSIVDSGSEYIAVGLPIKNNITTTNVYTQFISSWSDSSANSALTGTPTSIANPGTTWNSVATDTPYNLSEMTIHPNISSISPSSGGILGGTSVTLTGTDFTGATLVTFGGTPATSLNVVNDTTITCITPAGTTPGPVDIIVTTGIGISNTFSPFTYIPNISSISKSFGSKIGNTSVTITGTSFIGATSVTFGGTPATSLNVVNDTTITCITPAHEPGAVGIIVTTGIGVSNTFSSFTYIIPPKIIGILTVSGSTLG